MFDHISKHLKIYQKYSATTLTLKKKKNPGVLKCGVWNVVKHDLSCLIYNSRRRQNTTRKQYRKKTNNEIWNKRNAKRRQRDIVKKQKLLPYFNLRDKMHIQ